MRRAGIGNVREKEPYRPMFRKAKGVQIIPAIHACRWGRPVIKLLLPRVQKLQKARKKTDISKTIKTPRSGSIFVVFVF